MDSINIIPIQFATPEYDQMIRLRSELLKKPLGLEFKEEDLFEEYSYHHLVAYDSRLQMIGCLVLVPHNEKTVQMIQVAVVEEYQRQGIGTQLVNASESLSKNIGFKEMILHARDSAVPFYNKLKYKKFGTPFEEVTIKHFKMKKKL